MVGRRYLHLLEKGEVPLDFPYCSFRAIIQYKKNYKHIFVVVDAFTKFGYMLPELKTQLKLSKDSGSDLRK